jgi:hypothetical protein
MALFLVYKCLDKTSLQIVGCYKINHGRVKDEISEKEKQRKQGQKFLCVRIFLILYGLSFYFYMD